LFSWLLGRRERRMRQVRRSRYALWAATAAALSAGIHPAGTFAADVTSTWFGGVNLWSSSNWINNPPVSQYPNDGNGGFTYDAVLNSGQASLTEFITIEGLMLAGAQIDASGFALQANKTFNWSAGTLAGSGTTIANGGINISNGGSKTLQQILQSAGTTVWTGSEGLSGGGTFQNLVGATFDCQNDGLLGGAFGTAACIN